MLHEQINFANLSYDELIGIIKQAQLELFGRGTITICKNIKYNKYYEKPELITGYTVEE